MTSIIISGRPNSEEMSECIIVAENIANMYPRSRFTIVLKSPKEWEQYCEDLCNLFGILKKTHPLILFSNGKKIGGAQDFFKLISESFKYDKLIKKGNEYALDIDPSEVAKLTKENAKIIEKEYFCRTKGNYIIDKINQKLDEIPDENFIKYYSKYNTIETDYTKEFIDDMQVYVKYDNKFTPDPNDYIDYKEVTEQRPAFVDKEKYNAYHEELRLKIELEKRLKREAEEEAKRKMEEEQKLKEEAMRAEEENKESEGNNTGRGKKDRKKKKEEEEKKKKEEEKKKKEEEERKKKEEEEKLKKEEEEKKKKEEEEKLKTESGQGEGENEIKNTESAVKEEEQPEEEKVIKYKRIFFKCYSDFDIPYDKYKKELLIESFKDDNFELIINPCFTFFGETLINKIKDYEAPLLPEREEPIIEEEEEEQPQMIISSNDNNNANAKDKNQNKNTDNSKEKKENKFLKITDPNNTNGTNPEAKKETPLNTATSNISGKKDEKKSESKNKLPIQVPPLIPKLNEVIAIPEGKIGGPTKSTKPNTYKPNLMEGIKAEENEEKEGKTEETSEIIIKDYGRLPSLRVIEFGGDDLRFYQDYIPPYQLKEHIFNCSNLFNFSDNCDVIDKDSVVNMIQMINETDGYATYKVLPYSYTDWKKYSSNKIKIMPNKSKDIKNVEYPLVDKINQQINKFKRSLFENNFKDNDDDNKNLELILHNEDFDQCFSLPEFFTLDIYKKNNIPHLVKTFSKGTFIYVNLKFAINKMCELLDINNQTGYGFCLVVCKQFIFMAPIKEPFTYTKGQEGNKDKGIEPSPRIPLFIEPYYFMGIYTLPYIESEWPESIKRKNVKFDLLDILKKSTN